MKVLVVGAGPAGLLMANCLVRRPGYAVQIVDKKPNPLLDLPMSKSYPISLQARGLEALGEIPGLEESVESQGIRPAGVCFHQQGGSEQKIAIDPPKLFCDHSQMTRTMLENLMQADVAKGSSLSIDFNCALNDLDLDKKKVSVTSQSRKRSLPFDVLVVADGGRSKVRHDLEEKNLIQVEQKDIPDEYRTICISETSSDGSVNLDSDYIHGWVLDQGRIRIVAAPMDNNCLNGAFVSEKNHDPISNLKSPQDVLDYIEELSPKSLAKLVSIEEATRILNQPATSLVTVKCDRLHVKDCILLIGDAAHAMTQSVGHGCISALQDVQVFCQLLDEYNDDWQQALPAYTRTRLADAHALSIMSEYAAPSSQLMKIEWGVRQLTRKLFPAFGDLMRPLPVELLSDTTLSYSEILEKSRWWIDRVKNSKTQ